ncbi:MAG: OB-fold nucleic acid binding domain-containing protein [Candidatus Bathyarchaeia archaeon]
MNICDLTVGMKNVNVEGEVAHKSETMEVYSRFGNKVNRVANVTLRDHTGSIKLILWNEQINGVAVGNIIRIENGYVTEFRGEKQLNVGKRTGKISVVRRLS